jgi:hypothetical protein
VAVLTVFTGQAAAANIAAWPSRQHAAWAAPDGSSIHSSLPFDPLLVPSTKLTIVADVIVTGPTSPVAT